MKQCTVCSKSAVYHVTALKDGDVNELHFCEQHFHEYMSKPNSNSPSEEIEDVLFPESNIENELTEEDEIRCPNCGISYREFRESGRFGCPHDYVVFRERLLPLLENIHNDTEHRGKFPQRAPLDSKNQYRMIQLRKELTAAIETEDYEQAAKLRDQIRSIETGLEQPSE
ncbi:MAG: UvrB/UvrC motif-containing protein [Planctomycetaceae bacterium]|nr:UvrB/UvrC motif-containing protein [Planctomycetaceae bacterium]